MEKLLYLQNLRSLEANSDELNVWLEISTETCNLKLGRGSP